MEIIIKPVLTEKMTALTDKQRKVAFIVAKEQNATIIIETTENKENVKLKIKDNGIGIKKSEIDRIFDKGFTGTNGRNQKKSTGIGLYLCKRLCEEIGMNLKAESIENEYTEMIITIPRNKKINE